MFGKSYAIADIRTISPNGKDNITLILQRFTKPTTKNIIPTSIIIGLVLDGHKGDDGSGNWINSWFFKVDGATADDIVAVASVNNYGSSSLHPSVASLDEYLAQDNAPVTAVLKGDEPFSLYRISDALGKVTVYSAKGGATGIKTINVNAQNTADAPIYSLNGVRMNSKNNLPKGVYIQGGKKFVVK